MLKLYHGATSVCSQKVRIGLAEIGLDYDGVLLDLQKGDQFAEEYRRLNPDAVVPTLVDDELVLVESSLILEYLDREHNGGRLMPKGRAAEARARHWLLRTIAIHQAINTLSFSTAMRKTVLVTKTSEEIAALLAQMPDPLVRAKRQDLYANGLKSLHVDQALAHLGRCLADMQSALAEGPWISGADFGISDIALLPYIDRLERLGFAEMWGEPVAGWLASMQARPSYATAIAAFADPAAAARMRDSGAEHWPELQARWLARGGPPVPPASTALTR